MGYLLLTLKNVTKHINESYTRLQTYLILVPESQPCDCSYL